ncbi:ubiquinol-cytochrome c reductase iron-sulfur subunit [Kineosporia mesophila]|nr:Rieske 2Fe-2S domain-containing protein [Kineosporia mesophila]MCD5351585.1 Rieske 2Fe-2S domain-containing protein [Kineosporia mesophila]
MSTNDPDHGGDGVALQEGDLPARFENPGIPEHQHRMADTDPKAAKRAERQVAFLFVLSMVGTLVMIVGYFAVKMDHDLGFIDYLNRLELSNKLLGIGMAISLLGIGVGAVHWAKTLMPDEERIDYRHLQRGSDEVRAEAVDMLATGVEESGFARRPLIRNTLIGAMALFPLPGLILFRDTGPLPGKYLATTFWKAGDRLMLDPEGGPIKASDMVLGSVAHVLPEGIEEAEHPLNEKAKAAVLLIRLEEDLLAPESLPGAHGGIVAYSKICTHMGCPVALYEQRTHHLLCPCHQSTFDLTQNCKVIFGPAKRALPQLAITVDDEGYLVAAAPFSEPTGPSYWERS